MILQFEKRHNLGWLFFLMKAKLMEVNSEKDKKFRSFEPEIHYSFHTMMVGWPNLGDIDKTSDTVLVLILYSDTWLQCMLLGG